MTILSKSFHFFLKRKIAHRVKICIETFQQTKFDNISLHSLCHEFLPNLLFDVIFVTLCGAWPLVSKKYIFKPFFKNHFYPNVHPPANCAISYNNSKNYINKDFYFNLFFLAKYFCWINQKDEQIIQVVITVLWPQNSLKILLSIIPKFH